MATHNENIARVQQELWYLIHNEDVRGVLEAMIEKMKEVGDDTERLEQWRDKARAYIPDNPEYDENYWVAAYILYTNMEKLKEQFDRLDAIASQISETEDEIEELEREQADLRYQIEQLEEELEDAKGRYEEALDRFYELEDDKKYLLWDIMKIAEQIVAS